MTIPTMNVSAYLALHNRYTNTDTWREIVERGVDDAMDHLGLIEHEFDGNERAGVLVAHAFMAGRGRSYFEPFLAQWNDQKPQLYLDGVYGLCGLRSMNITLGVETDTIEMVINAACMRLTDDQVAQAMAQWDGPQLWCPPILLARGQALEIHQSLSGAGGLARPKLM